MSRTPDASNDASPAAVPFAIATPWVPSRVFIEPMSATPGRFASRSGSSVRRLAAMRGRAAFFAPAMGMAPEKLLPPRRRMASIGQRSKTGSGPIMGSVV